MAETAPHGGAPRIAILALAETSSSVIYGMYDLFMSVGRDWGLIVEGRPGEQRLAPRVVAAQSGAFRTGNGVLIQPDATLDDCAAGEAEIVCVPELLVAPGEPIEGRFDVEIEWIRRHFDAGATIATACSGAILLAQAGLLDGHDATTHWAYCDVMKQRYPRVRVHTQRSLVVSGEGQRLVMAGGGTSWLDLALYLIARRVSVEAAMQTARLNLIDWHDIGQQPFARLAQTRQVDDSIIARCQVWVAEHYMEAAPVAGMARLSGLAERSFKRRFQQATGMAPLQYVHTLRLEEAKQMLEAGSEPVEGIANAVGYEDAGFFSRLFRREVGLTPARYRRRFASLRAAVQNGSVGATAAVAAGER